MLTYHILNAKKDVTANEPGQQGEGGNNNLPPEIGGTPPEDLEATQKGIDILECAYKYLGIPYVYGGKTPETGFDCSGFVGYVYNEAGVSSVLKGENAQTQYNSCEKISAEDVEPGDLVFFGSSPSNITHVGIVVNGDIMIHAPNEDKVIEEGSISENVPFCGGGPYYGRIN